MRFEPTTFRLRVSVLWHHASGSLLRPLESTESRKFIVKRGSFETKSVELITNSLFRESINYIGRYFLLDPEI